MGICCRDLLELPALKNIRVAGGENGLDRIIDWVYFGDVIDDLENGKNWINGNELVILTGVSVKGVYARLKKMLPEYYDCNIAGILISFGRYFSDVPPDIKEEADRLSLPVFTLPWEVKLVDATRSICNAIISAEIAEHESSNILNALLFGSLSTHEHLEQILTRVNYSLNHSYRVGILEIQNKNFKETSLSPYRDKNLQMNILRYAHLAFDRFSPDAFFTLEKNALLFLIAEESPDIIIHAVKTITEGMERICPGLIFKAGIGKSFRHPQRLPESYRQARQALYETILDHTIPSPAFYSESDPYSLLFSIKDQMLLRSYRDQLLNPLFEHEKQNNPELYKTLKCYYQHNFRMSETAEALNIHKNTLKYRLGKIQEILSLDLKDPAAITSIQMAMKIDLLLKSGVYSA